MASKLFSFTVVASENPHTFALRFTEKELDNKKSGRTMF